MIQLIVADYCHSCPEFEPDVDRKSDTLYAEDLFMGTREYMTLCETTIRCVHRDRCKGMTTYLNHKQSFLEQ